MDDYGENKLSWVWWIILIGIGMIIFFSRGPNDSDVRKDCQKNTDGIYGTTYVDAKYLYDQCLHRHGLDK